MTDWNNRFLALADHVATWSKDSTQVGCVIVGPDREVRSLGYNGLPRGCDDSVQERAVRPAKYLWAEHAERNAVYNAARTGIQLQDCTAYCSLAPCMDCTRALVQSGLTSVVTRTPNWNDPKWGVDFTKSREMFHECKVRILYV